MTNHPAPTTTTPQSHSAPRAFRQWSSAIVAVTVVAGALVLAPISRGAEQADTSAAPAAAGTITTVATSGLQRSGHPTDISQNPVGVAVLARGTRTVSYVADRANNVVWAIDESAETQRMVVGTGSPGSGGDGGPAASAQLNLDWMSAVAVDSAGNLYIADTENHRIRKVVPGEDGVVNGGPGETIAPIRRYRHARGLWGRKRGHRRSAAVTVPHCRRLCREPLCCRGLSSPQGGY